MLSYDTVRLDDCLTYIDEPMTILARDVSELRYRYILVIKVQWRNYPIKEAT